MLINVLGGVLAAKMAGWRGKNGGSGELGVVRIVRVTGGAEESKPPLPHSRRGQLDPNLTTTDLGGRVGPDLRSNHGWERGTFTVSMAGYYAHSVVLGCLGPGDF